jgi:hypothetical protein
VAGPQAGPDAFRFAEGRERASGPSARRRPAGADLPFDKFNGADLTGADCDVHAVRLCRTTDAPDGSIHERDC